MQTTRKPHARRTAAPERALQRACIDYLRLAKIRGLFWTAINPVPGKSIAVAAISKSMGVRAGVPDMILIRAGRTVFVEFKADKGRLKPSQKELFPEIIAAGVRIVECRSLDEFLRIGFFD